MSSASPTPNAPRPSVFISYASEDRAAARTLRDALTAAGLDVWYDESELGGGDAWDQKIRRQIRDCEYFLPVISAATERRKEGYFRREWRLAAERTMDMADDVLFLLPVTIDGTTESSARVPEKFLHVQWLRAPGGQPTPAFATLIQRLLAGEHHALPRPPTATRTPLVPPEIITVSGHATPPPMPPFPHAPEKASVGSWLKFIAEILWWFVTATWTVVVRLPRWLRIVLAFWAMSTLLFQCDRVERRITGSRNRPPAPAVTPTPPPNSSVIRPDEKGEFAPGSFNKSPPRESPPGESGRGGELGRRSGKNALDPNAAGKALVLVPFTGEPGDGRSIRFAMGVFHESRQRLLAARPEETADTTVSIANSSDEALTLLGRNLGARVVLGARTVTADGTRSLAVRMIRIPAGTIVWQADYPIEGSQPPELAAKIAEGVLGTLPPRK